MDEPQQCSACGARLPSGIAEDLCPKCLLRAGLETHSNGPSPTDAETPAAGTKVKYLGDYELLEEIARGGMGVVYKARQDSLNRTVALKMILAGQLASVEDIQRFHAEAEAAANLDHPGIVPIFEVGEHDGQHYFSMGFVDGRSLAEHAAEGPLAPRQAAELTRKIAEALAYAHARGVIHRDLKPSNIMLDTDGRPHVLDFGLAKRDAGEIAMTVEGQVLGTPAYMSPEQAKGESHTIDARSDIYSLGVILYELLTGELPFRGNNQMLMVQVLQDEPQPLRRLNNHIPRDLETICLKCLEKDSRQRYVSAEELAQELQRWLEGRPVHARPVARPERVWRWCKRNPAVASLSFGALLLLLVLSLVSTTAAVWINQEREAALSNERIARDERAKAKGERALASAARADASERLVRMQLAKGESLVEKGDLSAALLWFARALKTSESAGVSQAVPRLRIAELLNRWPKLIQVFDDQQAFAPLDLVSNDGQYRLTLTRWLDESSLTGLTQQEIDEAKSRLPQIAIWNTSTGQQVGETIELAHSTNEFSAFFSPDGRRFATKSGKDLTVRVWDTKTGKPVSPLLKLGELPPNIVSSFPASLSRDGRYFSGEGQVWDVEAGKRLTHLSEAPKPSSPEPVFSPDGAYVATFDEKGDFRVWDVETGKAKSPTMSHDGDIKDLHFSPDGRHIATTNPYRSSEEDSIRIWDVQSGEVLVEGLKGDEFQTEVIAFSPDGKHIVTTTFPDIVRVWSAQTGEPVSPELRHGNDVNDASSSTNGRLLRTTPLPGKALDSSTFEMVTVSPELPNYVTDAAFSPHGRLLVTASNDGYVRVWNALTGHAVTLPVAHEGEVRQARFSLDGKRIYTGGDDGARVWELPRPFPQIMQTIPYQVPFNDGPAFSADGRWAMLQSRESGWRLWDLVSGQQVELPLHPQLSGTRIGRVWLSSDGSVFGTAPATAIWNGVPHDRSTVRLWNAATGKPLTPPIEHKGEVSFFSFSEDARKCVLVSGSIFMDEENIHVREQVQIIQAGSTQSITLETSHDSISNDAGFTSEGDRLVRVSPGFIQLWDATTGKALSEPKRIGDGGGFPGGNIVFSPDGKQFVVSCGGKVAQVWDAAQFQPVSKLITHKDSKIKHVAFSPDGTMVATAGWGGSARVWDAASGEPVSPWLRHEENVEFVSFSPDSGLVITAGWEEMIRVWDVATGEEVMIPFPKDSFDSYASITPDGRRLVTVESSRIVVRDLQTTQLPIAELVNLSQILAGGQQLDAAGNLSPINASDLRASLQAIRQKYPAAFCPTRGPVMAVD